MASVKKCVAEFCKGCIYDETQPGSWRQQVEDCPSEKSCPLWPVRPLTIATINANRKKRGGTETEDDTDADTDE